MKTTFTLKESSPGEVFLLGGLALRTCSHFQFVFRGSARTKQALRLQALLEPYKTDERISTKWPGTELLRGEATLFRYRLEEASLALLCTEGAGEFSQWVEPLLPEDLSFLRADGTHWLGSISHEGDVFLDLTESELVDIQKAEPSLARRMIRD